MGYLSDKVALITGASRGIGASVAQMLAEQGADVVINYRSKQTRAEAVAEEVRRAGRQALTTQADITNAEQMAEMFTQVASRFGRLDLLILNASGGLEKDGGPDYAMQVNVGGQLRAVDLALPLMPAGGRIVYVTSHLAHFYGQKPVYPGYEPVAESKKAGEKALLARLTEFAAADVSLVMVSGDLIEGTITPRMMQRQRPGLIEARREQAGYLPSIAQFAHAIVEAAADVTLANGAIIYVGSTEWVVE